MKVDLMTRNQVKDMIMEHTESMKVNFYREMNLMRGKVERIEEEMKGLLVDLINADLLREQKRRDNGR